MPTLARPAVAEGRNNADALYAQQEAERQARRARVRAAAAVPPIPPPADAEVPAKGGARAVQIHDDEEWDEGEGAEEYGEDWVLPDGEEDKEDRGFQRLLRAPEKG